MSQTGHTLRCPKGYHPKHGCEVAYIKLHINIVIQQDPEKGDISRTSTEDVAMGGMLETIEIGEELEEEDLDMGQADLLTQAQKLLLRLVLQDDPAELRRVASRYLADSMSPAAVRAALGPEHVM
jgi:hypothetical protein